MDDGGGMIVFVCQHALMSRIHFIIFICVVAVAMLCYECTDTSDDNAVYFDSCALV